MGNKCEPDFTKTTEVFSLPGMEVSVCSMRGNRSYMEDEHIVIDLGEDYYMIAVFDGHGEDKGAIANFLKENLCDIFIRNKYWIQYKSDENVNQSTRRTLIIEALRTTFMDADRMILKKCSGYKETGSTCTLVLITPIEFYCANCGDSRSVLINKIENSLITEDLSTDHKPYDEDELERIISAGSNVSSGRINGKLAVSRSFGDFKFKKDNEISNKTAVTAYPDVTVTERSNINKFLILGCDGLWDIYIQSDNIIKYILIDIYPNAEFNLDNFTREFKVYCGVMVKLLKSEIESLNNSISYNRKEILNFDKNSVRYSDLVENYNSKNDELLSDILEKEEKIAIFENYDCNKMSRLEILTHINEILVHISRSSRDNVTSIIVQFT